MADRVLITGGSGFVGSCLTRELISAGYDVHLLLRPGHKTWRLSDLNGHYTPKFADLRDAEAVRTAVTAIRPDIVYHLAAHGVYPSQRNRSEILATNVQGTSHLLRALATREYQSFVYAGSSTEYGHKVEPMREDAALEPRGDYAEAKAAGTRLCQAEAEQGKPVSIVRLFSVYGPWEEPSRLVPHVMGCCMRGENLRVTAGSPPRDFIAVDDVVALLRIAASNPAARGQVLHAGTGVQSRIRQMIEAIITTSGRRTGVQYGVADLRPNEPERWVASIEQTTTLTGWRPRHDLASGVSLMWDWYREWAEGQTIRRTLPKIAVTMNPFARLPHAG